MSVVAGTAYRFVAAKLRGGDLPLQATLLLTNRCNLRCSYCGIPLLKGRELSTREWCRVLGLLYGRGTRRVLFFGGEPLLRDDVSAIASHAQALGMRLGLTSNGVLVPERRDVVRLLHSLTISLDGSQEAHDRTRGAGSQARAVAAVEAARSWGVPVKVNAVLSAHNAEELPWLIEWSRRECLPVVVNLMRSDGRGPYRDAARQRIANERVRALLEEVLTAKRRGAPIVFSRYTYQTVSQWPDYAVDRLTRHDGEAGTVGPPCSAGRFHCAVSADGRIYPCVSTVGLVPALGILDSGLDRALETARDHGCRSCFSPCMIEMNALFALRPSVLMSHLRLWLGGPVY